MAASRPRRYTAKDVITILNADDSDVDSPPSTDDENDNWELEESDLDDETEMADCEEQTAVSTPGTSSDNSLTSHPATPTAPRPAKCVWLDKEFHPPDSIFTGDRPQAPENIETAYKYFKRYVTDDMLQLVANQTNMYSTAKTGQCINITTNHIEMIMGMFFRMDLHKMLGVRCYFEKENMYGPVSDIMPRNKMLDILRLVHFTGNEGANDETKKEKLWKIRPWLDKFREQCLKACPEECNSIDEMMIPFRGKFSGMKQYIRGKPHPWGFKV